MKKPTTVVLLLAVLMLTVTGCQKIGGTVTSNPASNPPSSSVPGSPAAGSDAENSNPASSPTLPQDQIKLGAEGSFQNLNVSIGYPTFTGGKSEQINALIQSEAVAGFERNYKDYGEETSATISYSLSSLTNNLLSIAFQGDVTAADAAYPSSISYGLNIDLNTGKKVVLNEIVTINDDFVKMLMDYSSQSLGEEYNRYLLELGNEELKRRLLAADTEGSSDTSVFTDGQMTILLQAPHAIGDYLPIAYVGGEAWKPFVKNGELFS